MACERCRAGVVRPPGAGSRRQFRLRRSEVQSDSTNSRASFRRALGDNRGIASLRNFLNEQVGTGVAARSRCADRSRRALDSARQPPAFCSNQARQESGMPSGPPPEGSGRTIREWARSAAASRPSSVSVDVRTRTRSRRGSARRSKIAMNSRSRGSAKSTLSKVTQQRLNALCATWSKRNSVKPCASRSVQAGSLPSCSTENDFSSSAGTPKTSCGHYP